MLEKIGIGIDIVDTTRFKLKPFESNKRFYQKIFHDSEIKHCLEHADPSQSFAAKFAIKEAVIKSVNGRIDFLDILTDHLDSKPTVILLKDSSCRFLVSVSHEKLHAIAVVISEKLPL